MMVPRWLVVIIASVVHLGSRRRAAAADPEPLKVVFAGLGRSGSHSFAAALKELGYNPCHGSDVVTGIQSGSHERLAAAMVNGNVSAILGETSAMGYNATLEAHAVFWRDIYDRARRPNASEMTADAKFIFTIRDFDSWFESFVLMRKAVAPMNRYPLRVFAERQRRWSASLTLRNFGIPESEATIRDVLLYPERRESDHRRGHTRYVDQALEITRTDPEGALLFDLKSHGYAELCEFLSVPRSSCPDDEPFPHVGRAQCIRRVGWVLRCIEVALYLLPVMAFGIVLRHFCWKPHNGLKLKQC